MEKTTCDIFISGGGPAGLVAAATFGSMGAHVILADPQPPVTDTGLPGADLRTTAILQPGRALMERAGIWPMLEPHARPLASMRIVDAVGTPVSRDFEADDIGGSAFGWNMTNTVLRAGILARLEQLPNVDLRLGVGFARRVSRSRETLITLTDESQIRAKLAIACDGRNSPLRDAAGIGMTRHGFGQKAIVFAATHPAPHAHVSTEVHKSGGPFTLVPLPDHDGQPCSGIVWMADGPDITRLSALSDAEFATTATERSAGLFGPLTLVSKRQVWPIISQIADRMDGDRLALAAEAAHVVPPIGAQGLNMSLADIGLLANLTEGAGDPGDAALLARYHRQRWPDIRMRMAGVGLLNRASQSDSPMVQQARAQGIQTLHDVRPLRQLAMRLGLGGGARY